MATDRARQRPSLPRKLEQLQREGRLPAPLFTTVPYSGLTPVEAVLDEAGDLKSVILLGFTRDGCHLVSYTTQSVAAADGVEGHCLQLWSFQAGARCRRLWSVPLFRTDPYLDALADSDFEAAAEADNMLLTVAEMPDSSLLVVHGRSADPAEASSRDHHLPNFLTLIPGPLYAGASQLQVAHLSYNTAFPHAPFNPYHALTHLDGDSSSGSELSGSSHGSRGDIGSPSLAVAMYTGEGVRYVHVAVSRCALQAASGGLQQPPPQQQSSQQGGSVSTQEEMAGEDDSSSSHFAASGLAAAAGLQQAQPAPAGQRSPAQPPAAEQQAGPARSTGPGSGGWPGPAWPADSPWRRQRLRQPRQHAHLPMQQQQQQQQSPAAASSGAGVDLGLRCVLLPCAHACVGGSRGQRLACSSDSSSRGLASIRCVAAPQELDLERCIFAALQQHGLPPSALLDYAAAPVQACSWRGTTGLLLLAVLRLAQAPAQQQQLLLPPHRSSCVLLHTAADSGAASMVEWLEPPYPWHDDLSAILVQHTAFAGLAFEKAPAFFAEFFRSRYGAVASRQQLPLVLTNRSVLGAGTSLQHIAHPWLPQAILGYGSSGV